MNEELHKISTTEKLYSETRTIRQMLDRRRKAAFSRFPLLFTLLGSFGLVATFYGFERLIDQVPLFVENPVILLATGVGVLVVTGTIYKKLQ